MWECSAEQVTEITVEHVGIEFTPTATSIERGVLNLKFVLQQMHPALMALTSDEANSRQNPLEAWQRLQTRSDPTAGGRKRKLLRTIIFSSTTLSFRTSSNHRTMESYVSRFEENIEGHLTSWDPARWSGGLGVCGTGKPFDTQLEALANV